MFAAFTVLSAKGMPFSSQQVLLTNETEQNKPKKQTKILRGARISQLVPAGRRALALQPLAFSGGLSGPTGPQPQPPPPAQQHPHSPRRNPGPASHWTRLHV